MKLQNLLSEETGKSLVVLGNEAIARGAIEGGLQAAYTYPGTPSSEIMNTLSLLSKKVGYYAEFSGNEKIALEGAFAASMSGLRSLFCAKHVGINVAMDALMTVAYSGTRGGMVIISADDPAMHSSQNEQDNRWLGRFSNLLVMTPSDAQEAQEFTRESFELSEKFEIPVFLRTTTRVNHSRSNITLAPIMDQKYPHLANENQFEKDPARFVTLPMNARANHRRVIKILAEVEEWANTCKYNKIIEGSEKVGIITSGVSFTYVMEAKRELKKDFPILKIGIDHPLPKKKIIDFINNLDQVIVIEENEPVIELGVREIVNVNRMNQEVLGKNEGVTTVFGELDTLKVIKGIAGILKLDYKSEEWIEPDQDLLVVRPPTLCPGCPHRGTFYALNKATRNKRNAIVSTDIGCYTLGFMPPLHIGDSCVCMGASIGVGSGWSHSGLKEDKISVIGDSTFWHTGLSGLASAVYNRSNITLLIVDNFTTAMTGMQPNPSSGNLASGEPVKPLSLEKAVKGLGIEHVKVTNAFKIKETTEILKEAIEHDGVSVVISEGICQIHKKGKLRAKEEFPYPDVDKTGYYIDSEVCIGCATCATKLACPAISWSDKLTVKGKKIPKIDPNICDPCGVCAQVCPTGAIKGRKELGN